MKLRSLMLLVAFVAALAAAATPSYARLISIAQHVGHDQLQSACNAAGGEFSEAPEGGGYGCGTNCKGGKGTSCYVACGADGSCVGQVPGRLVADVTLVQLLSGAFMRPLITESDDPGTPNHSNSSAPQAQPTSPPPPAGVPVIQ